MDRKSPYAALMGFDECLDLSQPARSPYRKLDAPIIVFQSVHQEFASVVEMPLLQPCPERARLLKKAADARRVHDELELKAGSGIGTLESANEIARAALYKAEMATLEYLDHVREHGC